MQIPEQLQRPEFRFIQIQPGTKKPLEKDWQSTANYPWDHEKIRGHQGNLGILTGAGLVVFDADTQEAQNLAETLPKTFSVKTSKGKHYYYHCSLQRKYILNDHEKHLGEIQSKGQQVIIPGSVHPSGSLYEIERPFPVAELSEKELMKAISPFVTAAESEPISVRAMKAGVQEGNRNDAAFRLATFHRKAGATVDEAVELLASWNSRNVPPLPDSELVGVVTSAYRGEKPYGLYFKEDPKTGKAVVNHPFILDSDKVQRSEAFTSFLLDSETRAFGLLLPKNVDIKDKQGNVVAQEQQWKPAVVTSGRALLSGNRQFEIYNKIQFKTIPENMPLRWKLESIKGFLDGREPPTIKELFLEVRRQYEKFIYFQNAAWYNVHSLWDISTYFYDLFCAFPILELTGLQQTAKTKVMHVSRRIAFNATPVMVNPSEAVLFRETHTLRPTKYFDEVEKIFRFNYKSKQEESDSRAEIINASYLKGSTVPRIEKNGNKFYTTYYDCYSPCVIAGIRGLSGATADRSITHIMTRISDKDPRGETDPENNGQGVWQKIRDGLYARSLLSWKSVKEAYEEFDDDFKIKKRDLQLWKPLLAVAKLIGVETYESVKGLAERVSDQRREDMIGEGTFDFKILTCVAELVKNKIVYVRDITDLYKHKNPNDDIRNYFNRSVSLRLDKLGFKEFRSKDRDGSFFEITKDIFEALISPICPSLSSLSSLSSQSLSNQSKLCDDSVTISDDGCDDGDDGDDNDDRIDGAGLQELLKKWPNPREYLESWKSAGGQERAFDQVLTDIGQKGLDFLLGYGLIYEPTPRRLLPV